VGRVLGNYRGETRLQLLNRLTKCPPQPELRATRKTQAVYSTARIRSWGHHKSHQRPLKVSDLMGSKSSQARHATNKHRASVYRIPALQAPITAASLGHNNLYPERRWAENPPFSALTWVTNAAFTKSYETAQAEWKKQDKNKPIALRVRLLMAANHNETPGPTSNTPRRCNFRARETRSTEFSQRETDSRWPRDASPWATAAAIWSCLRFLEAFLNGWQTGHSCQWQFFQWAIICRDDAQWDSTKETRC